MPFIRPMGSCSEHQTVRPPSGRSSIAQSTGMKLDGRWCCGQLNSTPPEIQGPSKPDQRRFDHVLPVEEIVAIGAVQPDMDAPADLGQDHEPYILVLQVQTPSRLGQSRSSDTRSMTGFGYTRPDDPWYTRFSRNIGLRSAIGSG